MKERRKNNTNEAGMYQASSPVQSRPVMSRPSLFRTLEVVQAQVEYKRFGVERETRMGKKWVEIDPLYKELCLIIAEVLVRPSDSIIRIRGAAMETAIVQEVYRELRNEHVKLVADNFKKQSHAIHNKTSYLQTMLYNVLFEFDAHYTNLVKSDMGH